PDWVARAERSFGGANYLQRDRSVWARVQILYGLDRLDLLRRDVRCVAFIGKPDAIYFMLSQLVARVDVEPLTSLIEDPASASMAQSEHHELYLPENLKFGSSPESEPGSADFALLQRSAGFPPSSPTTWWLMERAAARLKVGGYLVMSVE